MGSLATNEVNQMALKNGGDGTFNSGCLGNFTISTKNALKTDALRLFVLFVNFGNLVSRIADRFWYWREIQPQFLTVLGFGIPIAGHKDGNSLRRVSTRQSA